MTAYKPHVVFRLLCKPEVEEPHLPKISCVLADEGNHREINDLFDPIESTCVSWWLFGNVLD